MAEVPGNQTVDFSVLVRKAAEASVSSLKELCETAPDQSDTEKKIGLLKYILKTRQRLLRLLALSKWCRQIPLVERCQQLAGTLSNHDTSFTQAADFLFYLHDTLQQARAPVYDIPTAAEILLTGSYKRLPKCIEDLGMQPLLTGEEKESALQKLDMLLRSRLLDISLPKEISDITVAGGRVVFRVAGEFEAHLTLGYRGNLFLWRVLKLDILVGEPTGPIQFTDPQRFFLGDDLERRMAASEDPLGLLYSVLHQFCTALVMDTLFRQIKILQGGRWKDAIKYDKISDSGALSIGQGTTGQVAGQLGDGDTEPGSVTKLRGSPGLKIVYWLEMQKAEVPPSLRIEHGADLQITCTHFPHVVDPITENEAVFVLDLSCINVEKLLLRAIACFVHTRLLEVQRGLKGGIMLWQTDSDVVLRRSMPAELENYNGVGVPISSTALDHNLTGMRPTVILALRVLQLGVQETFGDGYGGDAGEEILCIRAFGVSYMAVSTSIRTGRFLLRCPSTLLAAPVLKEMEDALNLGTVPPLDIFVNLRTKCLLQHLASIGRSLNLQLYDRGPLSVKLPGDGPKLGAEVLIMGFPQCGNTFFLALQLDLNFFPLFTLLESQPRSSLGRTNLMSNPFNIYRWMKIDIDSMLVLREDAGFSLLDQGGHEGKDPSGKMVAKTLELGRNLVRGPSRGALLGLEGMQSGTDPYFGGERGGPNSPSVNSHRGNIMTSSAILSPSNLQGGGSPQQHGIVSYGNGSLSMANPALTSTAFTQGKPLGGAPLYGDSNQRMGRMGLISGVVAHNVSAGSPLRSPMDVRNQNLHRLSPGSTRSPLQGTGDLELLNTKSPLALGENAASPIHLDDDDLSKLIDSISSKTMVSQSGISGSFSISDPSTPSRHVRPVQHRNSSMSRGATGAANTRPKSVAALGSQLVRVSGQPVRANSPGWKSTVPSSVPFNPETALVTQEWTDVEQSSQTRISGVPPVQGPSERSIVGAPKRKRSVVELFNSLPSLQAVSETLQKEKRRKTELEIIPLPVIQPAALLSSPTFAHSFVGQSYGNVIGAANQGKASSGAYRAVLLQVVRRCWLCIKHARLTQQMDAQRIPYVNEVGLREPSTVLRFRLPAIVPTGDSRTREVGNDDSYGWQQMCLCLGKPGAEGWTVEFCDSHFRGLWELQRQHNGPPATGGVQFASPSQDDAHMQCTHEGLLLVFPAVEDNSVTKLVTDLERIWRARSFAIGIRKLLEGKGEERKGGKDRQVRTLGGFAQAGDRSGGAEKKWEVMRRAFRVEAVGLTSVSFTYVGSMPGVIARFVVEWGSSHRGCTVHSPEQLWPHTKFLEDYINGGEVELLLDAILVTAGPLHALAAAIRPARMAVPSSGSNASGLSSSPNSAFALNSTTSSGTMMNLYTPTVAPLTPTSGQGRAVTFVPPPSAGVSNNSTSGAVPTTSQAGVNPGRSPGPGLVPSSLLPTDISVLLRSPYWVRIVYRREFAIDMRCFAGDQVWLQPAPPPQGGGKGSGGSLPCPQFRTFVVEHVTLGMNTAESVGGVPAGAAAMGSAASTPGSAGPIGVSRVPNQAGTPVNRVGNTGTSGPGSAQGGPAALVSSAAGRSVVASSSLGSSLGLRGELNPALVGMGDDGGYGGAWVPLAALKKVLRGTLRYLGGLWLFAQFPTILKEVLGSIMRENEGALLNHDPEQPALRFFIRGCMFAVNMHRQQLYLQAVNVKRYQQQQALSATHQQTVSGQAGNLSLELSSQEMLEIGDFFARRVASEPYDASRLASFVTLLTLPVPVLREFLCLIQWKKEALKANSALHASVGEGGGQFHRPRVELSLETSVASSGGDPGCSHQEEAESNTGNLASSSQAKSSIHHNYQQNAVEFTLTFSFDSSQVPLLHVAGGAGWLPQSVALRLTYLYAEGSNWVSLSNMEGSHGGRSCWLRSEDWDRCKEGVIHAIETTGTGEGSGRLKALAEAVQVALQSALMQLGKGIGSGTRQVAWSAPTEDGSSGGKRQW